MNKVIASVILSAGFIFSSALVAQSSHTVEASGEKCHGNPSLSVFEDQWGNRANNQGNFHGLTGIKMDTAHIINKSNCPYTVGIASYKAYAPYEDGKNYDKWMFTQTLYDYKTTTLKPGQTFKHTVKVPDCMYQVDIFFGRVKSSFPNLESSYGKQGRLIDAYFYPGTKNDTQLPACTKSTPTPTPKPTPTPTPKPTHTPTPTPTPKVKVTPTPCPSGTVRDGDRCGEVAAATPTPTPTPPSELPSTGPGLAVVVSLLGMVGGLLGKKLI